MLAGKFGNSKVRPYAQGLQLQSSIYGATIPVIYGRTRTSLYLIWANNFRDSSSSSKKGKKAKKGQRTPTYEENVDFLIGHNPIVMPLEFWSNNVKTAMQFSVHSTAVTPGVASVTVPNPNGYFRSILGVTLTVSYDETFNDYGSTGSRQLAGSYEVPLWNASYVGPDPTNPSAYRYYPYVYCWLPFSGSTVYVDTNALGALPSGTLKIYYVEAVTVDAQNQLNLQFEPQLGDGIAYGSAYASQQILYPQYAGLGSPNFDLGAGMLPNVRFEVLGAFPLYPSGDADFADMIEDLFKSGPAQCALGLNQSRTEIQHGLNCYDYPGVVQNKFFRSSTPFSTCTFDLPNTAGNILVVFASTASTAGLSISDSAGNTWTPIFPPGQTYQAWYATALAAEAGNTVTITGLGNDADVILLEVAGMDTVDAVVTNSGTSNVASASVTTTNDSRLPAYIIGWTNIDAGGTLPTVIPGRWPMLVTGPAFQWAQSRTVYQPGTYTLENKLTTAGPWRMVMIALKGSQPPTYPKPLGNVLDEETLDLCRKQCRAYGLWGSASLDAQKKASDWLEEFYQAMNAAPVWSGFRLKSIPYAEQSAVGNGAVYVAPTAAGPIADLQEADFIGDAGQPMITVERDARVDAPNLLQAEHANRASDYNQVITAQPEQSTIALYGVRKDSPQRFTSIQDVKVARMVLGVGVRQQNYFRDRYKFKLNAKWKLLEPMDLVTLTDPQMGIARLPVRLTKVEEDEAYNLACEARPFLYGAESPQVNQAVATTPNPNPQPIDAEPSNVNSPVIFQPPSRLSNQQSQLWLVVSNSDPNYGGCVVYISTNGGTSYSPLGAIQGNATTGVTVGAWPASADPDTTNDLNVNLSESLGELSSYLVADEDNFVYPCYVEGGAGQIPYELMTYAVAELTSQYNYTLKATGGNKLRRAVYGTPTVGQGVSHNSGSRFAFLDPHGRGILKVPLDPSWIGKTLYFKFPAFNQFGGGLQSLAGLPAYTYTSLSMSAPPPDVNPFSYTLDPNPCLSQSASQYKVQLAEVVAHFPTNDAHYNPREFTVPDPGGGSSTIPPGKKEAIDYAVVSGGTIAVYMNPGHGLSTGMVVFLDQFVGPPIGPGQGYRLGIFQITMSGDTFTIPNHGGLVDGTYDNPGYVIRGIYRRSGTNVLIVDLDPLGVGWGDPITVAGVDDSGFNGNFVVDFVDTYNNAFRRCLGYAQAGTQGTSSGNGTVTAGGAGNTQVYYVTVYDPGYLGDTGSQTNLTAYCETNQSKVGVAGYTYMGSIYVTHAGGSVIVTKGGWPAAQGYFVNGS